MNRTVNSGARRACIIVLLGTAPIYIGGADDSQGCPWGGNGGWGSASGLNAHDLMEDIDASGYAYDVIATRVSMFQHEALNDAIDFPSTWDNYCGAQADWQSNSTLDDMWPVFISYVGFAGDSLANSAHVALWNVRMSSLLCHDTTKMEDESNMWCEDQNGSEYLYGLEFDDYSVMFPADSSNAGGEDLIAATLANSSPSRSYVKPSERDPRVWGGHGHLGNVFVWSNSNDVNDFVYVLLNTSEPWGVGVAPQGSADFSVELTGEDAGITIDYTNGSCEGYEATVRHDEDGVAAQRASESIVWAVLAKWDDGYPGILIQEFNSNGSDWNYSGRMAEYYEEITGEPLPLAEDYMSVNTAIPINTGRTRFAYVGGAYYALTPLWEISVDDAVPAWAGSLDKVRIRDVGSYDAIGVGHLPQEGAVMPTPGNPNTLTLLGEDETWEPTTPTARADTKLWGAIRLTDAEMEGSLGEIDRMIWNLPEIETTGQGITAGELMQLDSIVAGWETYRVEIDSIETSGIAVGEWLEAGTVAYVSLRGLDSSEEEEEALPILALRIPGGVEVATTLTPDPEGGWTFGTTTPMGTSYSGRMRLEGPDVLIEDLTLEGFSLDFDNVSLRATYTGDFDG